MGMIGISSPLLCTSLMRGGTSCSQIGSLCMQLQGDPDRPLIMPQGIVLKTMLTPTAAKQGTHTHPGMQQLNPDMLLEVHGPPLSPPPIKICNYRLNCIVKSQDPCTGMLCVVLAHSC